MIESIWNNIQINWLQKSQEQQEQQQFSNL